MAVLALALASAPSAALASAPLRAVGTGYAPSHFAPTAPFVADGARYLAWLDGKVSLHVLDVRSGRSPEIAVGDDGPDGGVFPCTVPSAAAGRALVVCAFFVDGATQYRPYLVALGSGAVRPLSIAPNSAGFAPASLEVPARLGRYWLQGTVPSDDGHSPAKAVALELGSGKVVAVDPDEPVDRLPDLDDPRLPTRWCGPSWGSLAAIAYPFLVRWNADPRFSDPTKLKLSLDRCDGHRLVEQTPLGLVVGAVSVSPRILVTSSDVTGAVRAYRTQDGAPIGAWKVPVSPTRSGISVGVVGDRVSVAAPVSATSMRVYLSASLRARAPRRRTLLTVAGDARIGPLRLGETPKQVFPLLGPGTTTRAGRLYRYGDALISARFRNGLISQLTATSESVMVQRRPVSSATAFAHLRRRFGWRLARCAHPAVQHAGSSAGSPSTVLELVAGTVIVRVSAGPARCPR